MINTYTIEKKALSAKVIKKIKFGDKIKLNMGIDAKTQQIQAVQLTTNNVSEIHVFG